MCCDTSVSKWLTSTLPTSFLLPFVKNLAQEITPVVRVHRPVGHDGIGMAGPGFGVAVPGQGVVVPLVRRGFLEALVFDDRNELHVGGIEFMPEKAVNVQRLAGVEPVDAGQGVEGHAVTLEQLGRVEDFFERGSAALGDPVLVMDFPRAINAQADQEAVLLEKLAPFLVDQRAVGLEIIFDFLEWLGIFLFERDRPCGRNPAPSTSARRPARKTPPPARSRPRCIAG